MITPNNIRKKLQYGTKLFIANELFVPKDFFSVTYYKIYGGTMVHHADMVSILEFALYQGKDCFYFEGKDRVKIDNTPFLSGVRFELLTKNNGDLLGFLNDNKGLVNEGVYHYGESYKSGYKVTLSWLYPDNFDRVHIRLHSFGVWNDTRGYSRFLSDKTILDIIDEVPDMWKYYYGYMPYSLLGSFMPLSNPDNYMGIDIDE